MKIDSDQRIKYVPQRRKPSLLPQAVDLNDPASFRPLAMGDHASLLWPYSIIQGWMTKQMPPAFSFSKARQRRYVVLVDRMLYTYKTDNPQHDFREYFELTPNTNIFVTNLFPGRLYCIELQRKDDGRTWYLEAENVEDLKLWLDRLRRTVQWLRRQLPGVVTLQTLGATSAPATAAAMDSGQLPPSPTFFLQAITTNNSSNQFLPPKTMMNTALLRSFVLPDVLPPQLPPPTSRLPPPPTSRLPPPPTLMQ